MTACLHIMKGAGARIETESVETGTPIHHRQIVALPDRVQRANMDLVTIKNLYTLDGQKRFVASQGG
jgi:hypothetical protein